MSLYKLTDLKLVSNNIKLIIEKIEKEKMKLFDKTVDTIAIPENVSDTENEKIETTESENTESEKTDEKTQIIKKEQKELTDVDIKNIIKLTLKFVSDKQRKVYGGYAQNKIIENKNKNDAFYKEDDIPDIDVYSFEPIEDLIELCNIFFQNGYEDVIGKEAIHKETYKIFIRNYNAIDISYVPRLIYHNIPYIEINTIKYVHPLFSMIDMYRMLTEPLYSSFRWEKIFPRLFLLQKYYPFPTVIGDLPKNKVSSDEQKILDIVYDFLKKTKTIIFVGDYAYNIFCPSNKIGINHYEVISTCYRHDALNLIDELNKHCNTIFKTEFYPFFQFLGHSVSIICNDKKIVTLYNYNKRCTSYLETLDNTNIIKIGTFDVTFMFELILSLKMKVIKDTNAKKIRDIKITNLINCRENYLTKHNKTLLDDTIYKSFVITCCGIGVDPREEAKKSKEDKKLKKKSSFFYKPPNPKPSTKWIFLNSSGNQINKPNNLKIVKDKKQSKP